MCPQDRFATSYIRVDLLLWVGSLKLKPALQVTDFFFDVLGFFIIVSLSKLNCPKIKLSYAVLENCHEVLNMNLVSFLVCFSLFYVCVKYMV